MNPFLLFLLAILSPLLLAATLLVPAYAGIASASYAIYYKPGTAHPLAHKLTDVFYMIDVYSNVANTWVHSIREFSLIFYTAPLLLLPMLGMFLSLWLTGKLARKLMDIFQLGVHH